MFRLTDRRGLNARLFIYKTAIVVGTCSLSVLLAWMTTRLENPVVLIILSLLLVSGVMGLSRGSVADGLILVILAALVVRFSLPTGTQSEIPASMIITVAVFIWWVIHSITVEKRFSLKPSAITRPLIGFIIICLISYLWGDIFRDPAVRTWSTWPFVQLGGLAVMVLLPSLFLIAANQFRDTRWVVWLVGIIMFGGLLSIIGFYLPLNIFSFIQVRPLFPTWIILIAFSFALFNKRLPVVVRVLLMILAAIWFYSVFVLQFRWLSSWLPALIGVAFIAVTRSRRLFILIAIILTVYIAFSISRLQIGIEQEWQGSSVTRFDAWSQNWKVTREHLLLGTGPVGYAAYYMTYFPDEAMATHSNYIDVLSQTGILGSLFFLWFFVALGIYLWRLQYRVKGRGDFVEAFSQAAFGGYLGTVVAMGMGDWILPFVYTQTIAGFDYALYSWVILGAGIALSNHLQPQMEEE